MEKLPSQLRPDIARFGEIFDYETVHLAQRAADELNLTLDTPKYIIGAGGESHFNLNGMPLPDGQRRITRSGAWEQTGDMQALWDRVSELRAEV